MDGWVYKYIDRKNENEKILIDRQREKHDAETGRMNGLRQTKISPFISLIKTFRHIIGWLAFGPLSCFSSFTT